MVVGRGNVVLVAMLAVAVVTPLQEATVVAVTIMVVTTPPAAVVAASEEVELTHQMVRVLE